jgi:hypothetical protein
MPESGTWLKIRISEKSKAELTKKAERAKVSLSEYARRLVLGLPIFDAELGEAYRKLFRHIHATYPDDPTAKRLVAECFRLIGEQIR